MKNKLLKILLVMSFLPINVLATNDVEMSYEVPETEGSALFHLDTSLVAFTKDSLEKDINYHITTNKGNYYYGNGYKQYNVFIDDDVLTDSHGNDVELSVTFNNNQAQGTLNLNETVTDETTYTGRVISTSESTDVAGDYSTSVVVNFNLDDKLMKLASNVYTIHRGVTADTNYVEVPGVANGTTAAELRDNFLNTEGTINVYDENGNLIEDENKVVTTAMSVQLEDVPSSISTFSLKARAVNTVNDKLGIAIPGDVDGDGEVTGSDMEFIKNWILHKDRNWLYFTAADMDKDGLITVADMTKCSKIFHSLQYAEIDAPYLTSLSYKVHNYNGIKYIKSNEGNIAFSGSAGEPQVIMVVNDHQYDNTMDESWESFLPGISDEQRFYYYDELFNANGEIVDMQSMNVFDKRKTYYTTGMTFKILKNYYDENNNYLYSEDHYYDTLVFIINGDINCDGKINEEDKTLLTQIINGEVTNITTAQKLAADRNNDGIINQTDIDLYN